MTLHVDNRAVATLTKLERARQIRQFILDTVDQHPGEVAAMAVQRFGVTRQAVNRQLQAMVGDGLLEAEGNTQARKYRRSKSVRQTVLDVAGLDEHMVWRDFAAPVLSDVPQNVRAICEYGFTEMLNNVVDHSGSENVVIKVERGSDEISIRITDRGVGIFNKIKDACGLEDVRHAVFELTKGKLTTDPKRHTGEGVFFTSRMFDDFSILSSSLFLAHEREGNDWLLHDRDDTSPGTHVTLKISPTSTHTDKEVFEKYAAEQDDYAFNKTHVAVKFAKTGEETFVSRSQAKRIVARLERFKEVILDFENINEVGPAFADEIFRVFVTDHPGTHIVPVNTNEQVTKMIRRAESHSTGTQS
jgi:anti-sigma regulatory factor (Ser/Thr protein kinase)